jgi:hypothetical protein
MGRQPSTDDSNIVLLKGNVVFLLLIVFYKEWDDSMWSFWVEANVSILWVFFYICIAIGDQFL